MMEQEKSRKSSKTSWVVLGVLGVAAAGGVAYAVSGSQRTPKEVAWYGYTIRVEPRGLDEAQANGHPWRWIVSQDEHLLVSGPAESQAHAVDLAKSAIQERVAALPSVPSGGG